MNHWAPVWKYSKKTEDPEQKSHQHIIYDDGKPYFFKTREECRKLINSKWGYIKHREDLRTFPHFWVLPEAKKVKLILVD